MKLLEANYISLMDLLLAELSPEALFPRGSNLGNEYEIAKPSPYEPLKN